MSTGKYIEKETRITDHKFDTYEASLLETRMQTLGDQSQIIEEELQENTLYKTASKVPLDYPKMNSCLFTNNKNISS